MVSLKVSQKSLTKYSTLYRWNGHFGHLSEVIKNHKYQFLDYLDYCFYWIQTALGPDSDAKCKSSPA